MLDEHRVESMPQAPSFRKILGPSFILLGLGLGSGELILWPYLTSNFGMGIIWAAVLGLTFQFFINMEIERYSLTRGESIFVGFARYLKFIPAWFIFSTFAAWVWPGIIGISASLLGRVFGISDTRYLAIGLLVLIGIVLSLGPVLYKTVEKLAIAIIAFGVPAIFVLTLFLAKVSDWSSLAKGIIGIGNGYLFLPQGLPIASFLAAFAFSGAGGNLNLAQSFYIKEKGYGMGKFGGRITSLLTGDVEEIKLEGTRFEMVEENLGKFKSWWRLINWEHLLVFWATGAFTICLLGLLAFATSFGKVTPAGGIEFIFYEATVIAQKTLPFVGVIFLITAGLMLFSTQTTVLDATSRIMAENLLILKHRVWDTKHLPGIYYSFLWFQIACGILIFLLNLGQPLFLLTVSAILNAVAMFVHIGLTLWLNVSKLEKLIKPSFIRVGVMLIAFLFFGYFAIRTVLGFI